MEAGGLWSRYRDHTTGSSSGYTSGTIVSTVDTSNRSNSSHLSSFSMDMEAAIHLDMVELDEEDRSTWIETEKNDTELVPPINKLHKKDTEFDLPIIKKPREETEEDDTEFDRPIKKPHKETEMKHTSVFHVFEMTLSEIDQMNYNLVEFKSRVESLVVEFFSAPTSNRGGDMSVMEAWLEHLGVGWVLYIADGASTGKISHIQRAKSWIRAFYQIKKTMSLMVALFPYGDSAARLSSISEEEEPQAESGKKGASVRFEFHYVQFVQQTMFKMLAFVDVIVGPNTETKLDKIRVLLDVHEALSGALPKIHLATHSPLYEEVESIQDALDILLSANVDRISESIWSTMEQINKTVFMESIEDREHSSGSSLSPQGSLDIHKATRSVVQYIIFLQYHAHMYGPISTIVSTVVSSGKYMPQIRDVPALTSMIIEVASCLEEKLAKMSESSFLDHSCRFLFLINNSDFTLETLVGFNLHSRIQAHVEAFASKVDAYIESYLQLSWEPLFSCLLNPTPLWNKRWIASTLTKFESAFQKTYTTQKHWKVPNPKLRERLRKLIVEKNIPIYTKYIENRKVTNPKFTPNELEEMLQDMFEG